MRTLTLIAFLLVTPLIKGQDASTSWQTFLDTETLTVQYRMEKCHDEANDFHFTYCFLQFTNKSESGTLSITYTWDDESPSKKEEEVEATLTLQPGQVINADCDSDRNELMIYVEPSDVSSNHIGDIVDIIKIEEL